MSIMTWIENIMKWISILVHVNIGLVEAHSLVEFPCFLLFLKACPPPPLPPGLPGFKIFFLYGSLRFLQAAMTVLTVKK